MASIDEIGQEKQRISERLVRLDAEWARLGDQLNELEIAERVLIRFGGKADTTGGRRRERPARTAPAAGGERRALGVQKAPSFTIRDACLKAVQACGEGSTAPEGAPLRHAPVHLHSIPAPDSIPARLRISVVGLWVPASSRRSS